ncbi:LPXTG-motif cell wall-anchored protein [Brevibacterium paucivorans]|uniref:LPXTG-motif cell wall-anchored protein n=1 Tax=Brevibacterium paucivorans TaxID=170994 RepID=A0ABS2SNN0_9MICO|nr:MULTISPECIES: LPXTG cell wall anchor domain-containing protein [Brevibacterium]MBM7816878.1 LPXTG-motif cell wall-anchored protein [Brevibacterium paucivorans]MCG7298206.1 LPXTG cell wall anchor domain-containing protein [Brevibacterium sp. ACRRH]
MGVTPSKRLFSVGAVLAIGFAGVATTGTASFASEAAVAGAQFETNGDKLAKDSKVKGYAQGEDGKVLVFKVKGDKLNKDSEKFIRSHKNVKVVELEKPASFASGGQVVGGHPTILSNDAQTESAICSTGFALLSKKFSPQISTAGHCTAANIAVGDNMTPGTATKLHWADPTQSLAAGGEFETPNDQVQGKLKKFQMGAPGQIDPDKNLPGNTTEFPNGQKYIDFGIYDLTKHDGVYPRVTKWTNPSDLVADSIPVQKVKDAKIGDTVARSGRTTGYHSGKVLATGWFNVQGRMVKGFGGYLEGQPGDSGGPVITQDGGAAGVFSAYANTADGNYAWFSDLRNDLDQIGDGSRVLVEKEPGFEGAKAAAKSAPKGLPKGGKAAAEPVSTKVEEGGSLSGKADSMFTEGTFVLEDGTEVPVTVKDGKWSFKAPGKAGDKATGNLFLHTKYEVSLPLALSYTVTKASDKPTQEPTQEPSQKPTEEPTQKPSQKPSQEPTQKPSQKPTQKPTQEPTQKPSEKPSQTPTQKPTQKPTQEPSEKPTEATEPKLTVDPESIDVDKFAGDGEKDENVGVTYTVKGLKPGTKVTFQTKSGGEVVRETTGDADENGVAVARVWGESGPREGFLGKYSVIAKFDESELTGGFEVVDENAKPGDNGNDDAKPGDKNDNNNDNKPGDKNDKPSNDKSGNNDTKPSNDNNGKGNNVLPRTGTSALITAGVAVGMVAVGAGLVVASRRRKA